MANKYAGLESLQTFLANLKNIFAPKSHKHTLSDVSDYTVDTSLSSTSTNPVQNKVINEELDAIADAMGALELAIDGKSDSSHIHDDRYYTETEIDTKLSAVNTSITNIKNGNVKVANAAHADTATSADSATTANTANSANTANTANSAIKATQDANGNVIAETYETKADAQTKLDEAKEYADTKNVFYVNITQNADGTNVADKTFAEIAEAYDADRVVYALLSGTEPIIIPLCLYLNEGGEGGAIFAANLTNIAFILAIYSDNTVEFMENEVAMTDQIPTTLPNPNAMTINGTSYNGSNAVDYTSIINSMITTKTDATLASAKSYTDTSIEGIGNEFGEIILGMYGDDFDDTGDSLVTIRQIANDEAAAAVADLEPLVGTTAEITPTQVAAAIEAGRPIAIAHTDATYGLMTANHFSKSTPFSSVMCSSIVYFNGEYLVVELVGHLSGNNWEVLATTVAEKDKVDAALSNKADKSAIPTRVGQLNNDMGYITEDDLPPETLLAYTAVYTPEQALNAVGSGQDVVLIHQDETYGVMAFTGASFSEQFMCVFATDTIVYNDVPMLCQLVGSLTTNTWQLVVTEMAKKSDIDEANTYTDTKLGELEQGFVEALMLMYGDDISDDGTAPTIRDIANDAASTAVASKADANHNHDTAYDTKGAADNALASAKTYADTAATTVKNDLLNGAGGAYDTLKELGDLIDENVDAIEALEAVAAGKADKEHEHTVSDITDFPTALKNPNALTFTGAVTGDYDGSAAKTVNIIGKAGTGTNAEMFNRASEASGNAAHAEGMGTKATSYASHAEGQHTTANGNTAHAEGISTVAGGQAAHAEGMGTIASAGSNCQHVQGKYNIADTTSAHIVGNGTADDARSNAHTIDWDGNAWFAGDVYVGSTSGTNKDSGSVKLATINDIVAITLEEIDALCIIPVEVLAPGLYQNGVMVYSWDEFVENGFCNQGMLMSTGWLSTTNRSAIVGDLVIADSVNTIRESGFNGCVSLTSVTIPDSVTAIEADAFGGCTSLTSITFGGTVDEWNAFFPSIMGKDYWCDGAPLTQVVCSDGTITL